MDKDEIISKLGWFTQMKSIPPLTDEFKTEQIIFFENIIRFLQDKGLTTKEILKRGEKPTDNTEIKNGDLTEEGLKFYLYGIRKWRQKYDRAKDGIKAILPPNIDDFIFVWLASQILVIYLFLAIGISYLLKRKELLTKQDNGKAVPC